MAFKDLEAEVLPAQQNSKPDPHYLKTILLYIHSEKMKRKAAFCC